VLNSGQEGENQAITAVIETARSRSRETLARRTTDERPDTLPPRSAFDFSHCGIEQIWVREVGFDDRSGAQPVAGCSGVGVAVVIDGGDDVMTSPLKAERETPCASKQVHSVATFEYACEVVRKEGGYSVADLGSSRPLTAFESESVGEGLETRGFSDSDQSVSGRVNETAVTGPADVGRDGVGRALPLEPAIVGATATTALSGTLSYLRYSPRGEVKRQVAPVAAGRDGSDDLLV